MGRRLSAVLLAALLAFATLSCGGDSDDSSSDGATSQSDSGGTGDTQDADGNDDANGNDDADDRAERRQERREERRDKREERREDRHEQREDKPDGDDKSALPDDLPSEDSADTDDLPIGVDAVMQACEDVDPADTWPSEDDVYFDTSGGSNVVATAEVETKGGKTVKIACDIAGSEQNPQVMAYSPL